MGEIEITQHLVALNWINNPQFHRWLQVCLDEQRMHTHFEHVSFLSIAQPALDRMMSESD